MWCFPKEADAGFVYHMEDVLDVYCQSCDPAVPRICTDEMGKNLVKEKHPSEPAKPGQVVREDYTFEKQGSTNLFIAYEPLAGKRYLKVTEQRRRKTGRCSCKRCWKSTIPKRARSLSYWIT
jgi:hypothetical protein